MHLRLLRYPGSAESMFMSTHAHNKINVFLGIRDMNKVNYAIPY